MDYEFIGIDEGKQRLVRGNTAKSSLLWNTDLKDFPTARSLQLLDGNMILVGYEWGYFAADISTGTILRRYSGNREVTSVYRRKDGVTVLFGLNLGRRRGVTRRLLDRDNNIIEELIMKGNYMRLVTPLDDGGFFLCVNRKILRTDPRLYECCRYRARGFKHAWKALPLEDGKVLVSAGYGAFMAFFTGDGRLIRTFGRKGSVPREVRPYFYATFDMAVDGNILVANWQGHGPENGDKGRQLLCFSGSGEYLRGWSWPDEISSLQGLLLIQ